VYSVFKNKVNVVPLLLYTTPTKPGAKKTAMYSLHLMLPVKRGERIQKGSRILTCEAQCYVTLNEATVRTTDHIIPSRKNRKRKKSTLSSSTFTKVYFPPRTLKPGKPLP
jgi:hypothetical protein